MSTTASVLKKQMAILNRLFRLHRNGLAPEAALSILQIDFDQVDIDRMHELSLKAQQGTLNKIEQEEIDFYSEWGIIVEILHSKARMALKKHGLPVPLEPLPVPTDDGSVEDKPRRQSGLRSSCRLVSPAPTQVERPLPLEGRGPR